MDIKIIIGGEKQKINFLYDFRHTSICYEKSAQSGKVITCLEIEMNIREKCIEKKTAVGLKIFIFHLMKQNPSNKMIKILANRQEKSSNYYYQRAQ